MLRLHAAVRTALPRHVPGTTFRHLTTASSQAQQSTQQSKPMEVEVKIRLPDLAAYDKLAAVLAPGRKDKYEQDNYFFDGAEGQLEAQRCVCRLRFYDGNRKAVITVKGKQILRNGIGTASEVEEEVPAAQVTTARQWLDTPGDMLAASPLLQDLNKQWGIAQLVCLGGFRNTRVEYAWGPGLTLELDATAYPWGTLYELECETTDPEAARDALEGLLKEQGIEYSYSKTSKFANFINRTLL